MNIKIKNYIKKKVRKYNMVLNINKDFTKKQKKILIIYVHNMFISNFKEVYHTQIYEANQIVKAFINRGYEIDVVNVNEDNAFEIIKHNKYDIIFGLGELFYKMSLINEQALKILYLTENHPEFSYKKESERVNYYNKRNHRREAISRTNLYFKDKYFDVCDYVIAMGNVNELQEKRINFYRINPTGLLNTNFEYKAIKEESVKNFLWFGSDGAIHKGLDILYEVFSRRTDVNLYICGLNKSEKKRLRIKERKNIFILDKIDVKSDLFLKLCRKCCWMIYPSCSEAMSTSVLTCMLHGIIPILIKENGFEKIKDNAYFLKGYEVDYIENFILDITKKEITEIEEKRMEIYKFARDEFLLNKFNKNFNIILDEMGI